MINAVSISYGCVFKRSSKPTMKGSKVLSFEEARKEYKLQHGGLTIKKDINSNIKDSDALESFFEYVTFRTINSEGVDCTTACYVKHLEPNNINYPLNFL